MSLNKKNGSLMATMNILALLSVLFFTTKAFVPHPTIRFGGQAGKSITHTEITQLGFIRSLARFFIDTKGQSRRSINGEDFKAQHTIDELYKIAHPDWTDEKVKLYSHPLKTVIDKIQVRNALVDLNPATKNLPSAHFDAEKFADSNRRILELREKVIADASDSSKNLDKARERIGDLLHTLQDFYSHSNWIEMGKTEINSRIGLQEDIGQIADINQATCISDGCTSIKEKCNLMEEIVLTRCPMEYYDCKNNIRPEINAQGLLTSGYVSGQFTEDEKPVTKPTNVEKCSHGSVMDASAQQSPMGGINKDTMTPVYSPHYHLHFDAVKLAIDATERFFEDLRKDLGNTNFDRLFAINPTKEQLEKAKEDIARRKKYHFLTSTLSIGLSTSDLDFQKTIKQRAQEILSILFGFKDPDAPTYDLSDKGVDKSDINVHSGSLLIDNTKSSRTKGLRRRRY